MKSFWCNLDMDDLGFSGLLLLHGVSITQCDDPFQEVPISLKYTDPRWHFFCCFVFSLKGFEESLFQDIYFFFRVLFYSYCGLCDKNTNFTQKCWILLGKKYKLVGMFWNLFLHRTTLRGVPLNVI